MNRFTALGRAIDFAYPSNRWAVGLMLLGFVGVGLLTRSWLGAFTGALWVFATWALGRELDPDDPRTASVSAGAVLLLLLAARPEPFYLLHGMAVTGGLMLTARLLARTTGLKTTPLDLFTLVLMTPVLGWLASRGLWPLAVAVAIALALDAVYDAEPARAWLAGGLALLSGLLLLFLGRSFTPALPDWFFWGSVLIGVLGWVALVLPPYAPRTSADNGDKLGADRVTNARRVAALGAAFTCWTLGPPVGVSVGLAGLVGWVLRRQSTNEKRRVI
ncbi:MAG: hypothetical protein C4332_08040 [Meiothermus sp.]